MATSLTTLQQRVQTLYDVSGSTVLSAAELTQLINDAYRTLWGLVVGVNKDFRTNLLAFVIATGQTQALPADFAEMRFVRLNPGTNDQVYLTRSNAKTGSQQYDRSWRIQGSSLYIEPIQRAAGSYDMQYIPQPPVLVNGTDTLDAELDQFSDFIVYHAAVAALAREEGDGTEQLQGLLGAIAARVSRWASDQRASDPDTVQDVRRRSPWMWAPP